MIKWHFTLRPKMNRRIWFVLIFCLIKNACYRLKHGTRFSIIQNGIKKRKINFGTSCLQHIYPQLILMINLKKAWIRLKIIHINIKRTPWLKTNMIMNATFKPHLLVCLQYSGEKCMIKWISIMINLIVFKK